MAVWQRQHIPYKIENRFDGMKAFYLNAMLRALVFALVGIFTPIYIFQILKNLWGNNQLAMMGLIGVYLVMRLTVLVISIPVSKIIEKIGFRRSVMLSLVFLVLYFVTLLLADKIWWLVYISGILMGLNIPLYWISRFSVVSIDGKKEAVGKQVGFLGTLERVGGMLGPIAGAFMIEQWGFRELYLISFVVLIVSLIPLLSMPHHQHQNGVSLKGWWEWLKDKQFNHQAVSFVARAMDDYSMGIVWPLAIWLMGVKLETMGWVFSWLTFLALTYRFISGIIFDKLYKKGGREDENAFVLMSVGEALGLGLRILVKGVVGVLWVDGVFGFFGTSYRNISDDYMVLAGKRMHPIAFYTYRSMVYSLGVLMYLVVWMVGLWLGNWRGLVFGITALMVLASIVQNKESNIGC